MNVRQIYGSERADVIQSDDRLEDLCGWLESTPGAETPWEFGWLLETSLATPRRENREEIYSARLRVRLILDQYLHEVLV